MSLRSATGYQLQRAELLSTDSEGRRIPRRGRGMNEIPIRETRPTPNSTHGLEESEGMTLAFSTLSEEEREIWRLQHADLGWRTVREKVSRSELEDRCAAGWLQVGASSKGTVEVEKSFKVQYTAAEVAEKVGLTERQLRTRIGGMNRKLRGHNAG